MKLTTQSLRDLGPYYDPTKYFLEDWEGTLQDILKDDRIPAGDRIWVFSKVMPESKCREFARWCALQVVDLWKAPDVVREYLKTGNESLRTAAWTAAWTAAGDAARTSRAAARAAAGDAAGDAAWAAAWAAEGYAARAAARAAAGDAARDAAEQAQLQKAIELVNEEA